MMVAPKHFSSVQPNFIYKASISNKERKIPLNRTKPCAGPGLYRWILLLMTGQVKEEEEKNEGGNR